MIPAFDFMASFLAPARRRRVATLACPPRADLSALCGYNIFSWRLQFHNLNLFIESNSASMQSYQGFNVFTPLTVAASFLNKSKTTISFVPFFNHEAGQYNLNCGPAFQYLPRLWPFTYTTPLL